MDELLEKISKKLQSDSPEELNAGLDEAEELIAQGYYSDELVEFLTSLFFYDTYEYPAFQEPVERASTIVGKLGTQALPVLLDLIESSDAKAAFYFALAIGRIGIEGVNQVVQKLIKAESDQLRAFLIFGLGKVRDPGIKRVIPDLLPFLEDSDPEVVFSSARTLGKIFEKIEPEEISADEVRLVYKSLTDLIKSSESKLRAIAIHSLIKLVSGGFLENRDVKKLEGIVIKLLGKDKNYKWDKAFIVRKEAAKLYPLIREYEKK